MFAQLLAAPDLEELARVARAQQDQCTHGADTNRVQSRQQHVQWQSKAARDAGSALLLSEFCATLHLLW